MKYYIYTIFLLLLAASCSDDVQKWDNWPEWKLVSPLKRALFSDKYSK